MTPQSALREPIIHSTIDDALGPCERRFFGAGFRRAQQSLDAWRREGRGAFSAEATVHYPGDWSQKGERYQRPHLSTVDVIVIGGRLMQLCLGDAYGLRGGQLDDLRVREVRIKAGTAPVEDELARFPVRARLREAPAAATPTTPLPDDRRLSMVDCRVGSLRIDLVVEHDAPRPEEPGAAGIDPVTLLAQPDDGEFGTGYRAKRQHITDLHVDPRAATATATVRVDTVEHAERPGVLSVVDCLVVVVQIGQVLLYALDDVGRAESNTLWMRRTVMRTTTDRDEVVPHDTRVAVSLRRATLLEQSSGDVWRCAEVVGSLGGIDLSCSVAHHLVR